MCVNCLKTELSISIIIIIHVYLVDWWRTSGWFAPHCGSAGILIGHKQLTATAVFLITLTQHSKCNMLDKTFMQTEEETARLCSTAGLLCVIIAAESRGERRTGQNVEKR